MHSPNSRETGFDFPRLVSLAFDTSEPETNPTRQGMHQVNIF
jgi:hypothetical protein